MDTRVEHVKVVLAELLGCHGVGGQGYVHVVEELGHLGEGFGTHGTASGEELMAQGGQVSIVFKSVLTQPPAAEQRGHEGGDETTYVDEHVEDLETAVAFVFGYTEGFVTLFGGLNLKVVI